MSSSIQSQDQVLNILKKSFPKADKFKIIENSELQGNQNYTSQIASLLLEFEEDGIRKRKSLIVKLPRHDDTASFLNQSDFFPRERLVYDSIISRMNDYLEESLTPADFKTTEPNIIILENLIASGYEAGDPNRRLCDLNQCLPIFKTLAYFHATSHKISQLDPQLLQHNLLQNSTLLDLKKKATAIWEPIYREILAHNGASSLIPKLRKVFQYMDENWDEFKAKVHYSNFKFYVLAHGDFRKDNVLLKYGSNNAVEGAKLLDFQTAFWSTPIYDFMFFFTICANAEVVKNHFQTLVDWYITCLNEKLKDINCSQLYGNDDFMEDIRSLRIYTILNLTISSLMVYPLDRSELLNSIIKEKRENYGKYKEACLRDKLFSKILLSNLKLFDKLGLFES